MQKTHVLTALPLMALLCQGCMTTSTDNTSAGEPPRPQQQYKPYPGVAGAWPPKDAVAKTGYYQGVEVQYLQVGDEAYIADDVIVPAADIATSPALGKESGATISDNNKKWPNNLVYYKLDPALYYPDRVLHAIAHWEALTPIRFIPWTNQSGHPNYVQFENDDRGCVTYGIGMVPGKLKVGLHYTCDEADAIHEIGHVMGLHHEHNRQDRDTHIKVLWQNLTDNFVINNTSQFKKYDPTTGFDHGAFDFASVMMYPSYNGFSVNGGATMETWNGETWDRNTQVSAGDQAVINNRYPSIFTALSGPPALQIAVGANGTAWMIGNQGATGGGMVYKWTGSWSSKAQGAANLAVDNNGNAIIVTNDGQMKFWNGVAWITNNQGKKWVDVGTGGGGSLWALSNESVNGGYKIYRYANSAWSLVTGGATRIAVDPTGKAFVVNTNNNLFRYNGTGWDVSPGKARDMGSGPDGTLYIIEPTTNAVSLWTGASTGWKRVMRTPTTVATARSIEVGPGGNPWIVDMYGVVCN